MEDKHTHTETLLAKIQAGEIVMRPRAYFYARGSALVAASVAAFFVSVLLASFIAFMIRVSGEGHLLRFGGRGLGAFVMFFPWGWFFLDIILLLIVQRLLRTFSFGYRTPVVWLVGGVAVVALVVGFAIDAARVHDRVFERIEHSDIPFVGDIYRFAHKPPPPGRGVCRCVVESIVGDTIVVRNDDPRAATSTFAIVLPPGAPATSTLKVGDRIFVAGDKGPREFRAYGFNRMDPDHDGDIDVVPRP
jgi:hypothetical protein